MLVIKKGNTKDLQLSGFPVVGNLQSQPVKNGTGPSVYKGLVPKPAAPPTKPTQWKSQTKENKVVGVKKCLIVRKKNFSEVNGLRKL